MLIGHLYVFFGEMTLQIVCPFLNWVIVFLICKSYLYILTTSPLSPIRFDNFSYFGYFTFFVIVFIFNFFIFLFFRAAPAEHGGSQARCPVGATAADLCHSHSNTGSGPAPQLMAMSDP